MHRTPQGEADADHANAASDRLVTRRRLLLGVAGGVGLLGGGGLYVTRSLSGDFGGYDAPETQPMVTTRGRLDANKPPERSGSWDFDGADAVVLFVHGLGADAESGRDQAYTARLGLAAATDATTETDGPPVIGYSWASNVDWGPAKQTADANVAPLADWLSAWADDDATSPPVRPLARRPRDRSDAPQALADRERTDVLASVSLFGGAIPNDSVAADGRYGLSRRSMPPVLTSTVGPITSSAGCIASRIGLAQSVTGARGVIDCADRLCGCRRYRPGRGPLLVLPAGRRVSTASGRPN